MATKTSARFDWSDPLLLEQQLTQDEIHALAAFFSSQSGLQTPKHD